MLRHTPLFFVIANMSLLRSPIQIFSAHVVLRRWNIEVTIGRLHGLAYA